MCVRSHHSLHHISLVVPQCFDGVENIHNVLLLDHLVDAADGTERSRAPSASTAEEEGQREKEGEEDTRASLSGNNIILKTNVQRPESPDHAGHRQREKDEVCSSCFEVTPLHYRTAGLAFSLFITLGAELF